MDKYNNNDLIIKELTDKIILQKKHITIIEQDFIRMNENFNYQFEKYKNTINDKLKLNNILIDNFSKDIIYCMSIIDTKTNANVNVNANVNANANANANVNVNSNIDKKLVLIKKEYDDKFNNYDDYIYDINYQMIKLKHDINDKINELNIDDKIIKNNHRNNIINIVSCLLFQFLIFILLY